MVAMSWSRTCSASCPSGRWTKGWFGTFKGDSAANKNRGSSLYTGLAHASIEVSIFSVVGNVINLRSWHDETGLGDRTHPCSPSPNTTASGTSAVRSTTSTSVTTSTNRPPESASGRWRPLPLSAGAMFRHRSDRPPNLRQSRSGLTVASSLTA